MQALRNKFHGKSKKQSEEKRRSLESTSAPAVITPEPSIPSAVVTSFNEEHVDLPGNRHVDHFEKTEVIPPALPMDSSSSMDVTPLPSGTLLVENLTVFPTESVRTMEILPTEVIEKPMIVHESIRQEQIEEIQPIIQVEREKTEIRQIVQPLTDKEIKPVMIEERTLPIEVLPTIISENTSVRQQSDISTREFDETMRQVVEKKPIIQETEKWRIIEEIQPIIYREIIVPHVIRTSKPMREVIVEAPLMTEQVLQARSLTATERERWSAFFSKEVVSREVMVESAIPIISIPEPSMIRVVPESRKEILTETITTTTTTTAAPVVGSFSSSANKVSSSSSMARPAVIGETHDVKIGPKGERITRDSITTVAPTMAI